MVTSCALLLSPGNKNRAIRHTEMNQHSSRSHAILQLWIEQPAPVHGIAAIPAAAITGGSSFTPTATDAVKVGGGRRTGSAGASDVGRSVVRSKLNFVDLAGSERWTRKDHDLQDRSL